MMCEIICKLASVIFLQDSPLTNLASCMSKMGFPGGSSGKEPACQCRRCKRHGLDPWVRKIPWRRAWQSTAVSLPRESHGQRSLVGYRPRGGKKSDKTDLLSTVIPAGTSLVVQWLRLRLPTQRVGVKSLVGELRSYMPCSQKTKT